MRFNKLNCSAEAWGWWTAPSVRTAGPEGAPRPPLRSAPQAQLSCWPAPFVENTNSSNSVENEQLTQLLQTWADYCSSAELFWGIKTALRGWKPSYAKPFYSEKGEGATAPGTHGYLHQKEEAAVQSVRLWTLLICQHQCESKGYQAQRQEEE